MQKVLLGGIAALLLVAVLASNLSLERPSPALLETAEYAINQDAALLDRASEREHSSASLAEANRHGEAVQREANRHREEMAMWRTITFVAVLGLAMVALGAGLVIVMARRRMVGPVRGLMAQENVMVIEAHEVDGFDLMPQSRKKIEVRR